MDVPLSELESAALRAMSHAVIILDTEFRVRFMNAKAAKLLGVNSYEVLSSEFERLPGGMNQGKLPYSLSWGVQVGDSFLGFQAVHLEDTQSKQIGTVVSIQDTTTDKLLSDLIFDSRGRMTSLVDASRFLLENDENEPLTDTQKQLLTIFKDEVQIISDVVANCDEELKKRYL